jgi:hypothetical protein
MNAEIQPLYRKERGYTRGWMIVCVCAGVVGLVALLPYTLTRYAHPDEPASVSVLYRSSAGDLQYFPLIAALARGSISEFTIKEEEGTALRSFPFPPIVLHALCFSCFGSYGFAVADVITTVAYFLLFTSFLRALKVSLAVSALLSLLFTMQLQIRVLLGPLTLYDISVWGPRLPSPFVSEVFVLAAMVILVRILMDRKSGRIGTWLMLGVLLALVLQGDVYSAFILMGSLSAFVLCVPRAALIGLSRKLFAAGAAACVFCIPFFFQRYLEHPDIPLRWGLFPVPRLKPLYSVTELAQAAFPLALLGTIYGAASMFRKTVEEVFGTHGIAGFRRVVIFFSVLVLVGHAAVPLSTLLLGKGIQIFHFSLRATNFDSYCVIACLAVCLDFFCRLAFSRLAWPPWRFDLVTRGLLAVLVTAVIAFKVRYDGSSRYSEHLRRVWFSELSTLAPISYRAEFAELVKYLSAADRGERPVLATFDVQVFAWWLTFTNGYSFLADPFISTVSDHEIESRMATLCHLIGMKSEDYGKFLQRHPVESFWLSHDKYQASRAYAFSSLSDYPAHVQEEIKNGSIYNNFNLVLPFSESRRLTEDFDRIDSDSLGTRQLDIMVLTNDKPMAGYAPPSLCWRLTYQSPRFRVYERMSR